MLESSSINTVASVVAELERSANQKKTMLIQIEVQEDNRGLSHYSGYIDKDVLNAIIDGTHREPFIRLTDVFWPATREKKGEFEHDLDYIVRYGFGDRKNFAGDMYIRKENIILISPLREIAHRDGRNLGDYSAEKE